MAGGRFSKQGAPFLNFKYLNPGGAAGAGDAVQQGALTIGPAGVTGFNMGDQNLPGDRFILGPMDAFAVQNNNTGNLFCGTYRYVNTKNNSTSVPQRGRAAFWDLLALGANNASTTQTDFQYQVTSDEAANIGVVLMAGVYITSPTAGYAWFVQESGKATLQFRGANFGGALTGTPAIGCGVYLAAAGNANANNTVGLFDVWTGANSGTTFSAANATTAYTALDNLFTRYVGVAENLPSANNFSLVDVEFKRGGFRW